MSIYTRLSEIWPKYKSIQARKSRLPSPRRKREKERTFRTGSQIQMTTCIKPLPLSLQPSGHPLNYFCHRGGPANLMDM